MLKILKSPGKYVQGANVLNELDRYLQGFGNTFLIIIDEFVRKLIGSDIERSFDGKDFTVIYETFKGECSKNQIGNLAQIFVKNNCTAVIGIGGGKVLDTAKAVSYYAAIPSIVVPTVASTDSPCSSLSVLYKDDGEFDCYLFLESSPDMVLVDTAVIAKAPVPLLVAGMGDALATYFEARACGKSGNYNQAGGKPTHAAFALAELCWKYLQSHGLKAKQDAEAGNCTDAVETIVEVNTYLSSVGFESGGLAAAHAIQKGFTVIPELHHVYHGNKVAFCTLTQLIMENACEDEINAVFGFCCDVGLPVCFSDMGAAEIDDEKLKSAAEKACVEGSTIHNMPFNVTPGLVYNALIKTNEMGLAYKKRCQ